MVTVSEIVQQASNLDEAELSNLINQLQLMQVKRHQPDSTLKTGAEIVALLEEIGPIELIYPEIEDPVEWVKAIRKLDEDRLKPYWDEEA